MKKTLKQASHESGLEPEVFLSYVQKEWISGPDDEGWMTEDCLRAHLICELQKDFGVNDEAVPVILHLVDQLHLLHRVLNELGKKSA